MALYDLTNFLKLSAVLNYHLNAFPISNVNMMRLIVGGRRIDLPGGLSTEEQAVVMTALKYLTGAYHQKRRRLGPMAVLHPLRTAAIYIQCLERVNLVDILSLLLHDVPEDIQTNDFRPEQWHELETQFDGLMDRLSPETEDRLIIRLDSLTKRPQETYYTYIGRLLNEGQQEAETIQIKLADRLDNTLDMRIDINDPLDEVDFFEMVFRLLFTAQPDCYQPLRAHPPASSLNGAKRLFQLFKNTVLLSLIRQCPTTAVHPLTRAMFDNLAEASLREAQRTCIHIMGYHLTDIAKQRQLLMEIMEYGHQGKVNLITRAEEHYRIDGLFYDYFTFSTKAQRDRRLNELYQDKPLMLQAAAAFIVIFLSFMHDERFYVRGISTRGVAPFE